MSATPRAARQPATDDDIGICLVSVAEVELGENTLLRTERRGEIGTPDNYMAANGASGMLALRVEAKWPAMIVSTTPDGPHEHGQSIQRVHG
jgi:hypothetical protein